MLHTHTHTDPLTVIVVMSAFIIGIKFIDFRLIFYTLQLNQFISITTTVLVATILLRPYLSMQADTCCTALGKLKGLERSSRRHFRFGPSIPVTRPNFVSSRKGSRRFLWLRRFYLQCGSTFENPWTIRSTNQWSDNGNTSSFEPIDHKKIGPEPKEKKTRRHTSTHTLGSALWKRARTRRFNKTKVAILYSF